MRPYCPVASEGISAERAERASSATMRRIAERLTPEPAGRRCQNDAGSIRRAIFAVRKVEQRLAFVAIMHDFGPRLGSPLQQAAI